MFLSDKDNWKSHQMKLSTETKEEEFNRVAIINKLLKLLILD